MHVTRNSWAAHKEKAPRPTGPPAEYRKIEGSRKWPPCLTTGTCLTSALMCFDPLIARRGIRLLDMLFIWLRRRGTTGKRVLDQEGTEVGHRSALRPGDGIEVFRDHNRDAFPLLLGLCHCAAGYGARLGLGKRKTLWT
jgi:hypothetical protein